MPRFFRRLDQLLRSETIRKDELEAGHVDFPVPLSIQMTLALGGVYGACMGLFALAGAREGAWIQIVASTVKLPALFLSTLLVTFPALYVFSALAGEGMRFLAVLRLLLVSVVVTVAVAASLAPILAFFTLSTKSYPFMVLLNVGLLTIAGSIGIGFLRRALIFLASGARPAAPRDPVPVAPSIAAMVAAEDQPSGIGIFRVWLIIYGLVGAQMAWLLRPFIGRPELAFTWFRPRDSSFFQAVFHHLVSLFGGG